MSEFETNIINIYGDIGKNWLQNLPKITSEIASKWELSNLKPLENLSNNYVLSGLKNKKPIILKLSLDNKGLNQEANALKSFENYGVIEVLALQDGALLLEHVLPAVSLKSYFPDKDDESVKIASSVIKKLHKAPIKSNFPHISEWLRILDNDLAIPAHYLKKARTLRDMLLQTSTKEVLLHGDLHHDNILQSGTSWVVIDPKGVIGDGSFEVASFIRNPIPELLAHPDLDRLINNRIEIFSDQLSLEPERVKAWCFVGVVLSLAWALEDGGDINHHIKLLRLAINMEG